MSEFKRFTSSGSSSYDSGAAYQEGTLTWDPGNGLRLHDGSTSGGVAVMAQAGLARASTINSYDPDVTCENIRVMMSNGVITVRHATGDSLGLIYSGRTVSASGSTTVLSTSATSVNAGDALTLATLANRGDSMIIDYLYDANSNYTFRINVFVSWSSLPYGGIIIERIS